MKNIAIKLGLAENATESEILENIGRIQGSEITLKSEVETIRLKAITGAVENAISEKRITADKKEQMITLGKSVGIDSLKSTLELMRPVTRPTDHISGKASGTDGETEITLASLLKKGIKEVEEFKAANPDEYAELYKKHYGVAIVKSLED